MFVTSTPSDAVSDGPVCFAFRRGYSFVQESYSGNASALAGLKALIRSNPDTLYIRAYSSPDGSYSSNEALSRKRAASVKSIIESYSYSGVIIVETVAEDWDSVAAILAGHGVSFDSSLSTSAKKAYIRSVEQGAVWRNILSGAMPQLRRVTVSSTE